MTIAYRFGLLALTSTLVACGSKKNQVESFLENSAFIGVDYDFYDGLPFDGVFEDELDDIAQNMIRLQKVGENFTSKLEKSGKLILGDGSEISLNKIFRNDCPQNRFSDCEVSDSSILGIPNFALIESLDNARETVKSQGSRGTCVAHAMTSAVEILLRREGDRAELSEQQLYFQAKKSTETWETPGLNPEYTFFQLTEQKAGISLEASWPYNPYDKACEEYQKLYPGASCSRTEAQGVGEFFDQPDPATTWGKSYTITKAHQLYASVGRIKKALHFGHPVVISVNINLDFELADINCKRKNSNFCKNGYVSWVFKASSCPGEVCGHAMVAIGYLDDPKIAGGGMLIIKNSWGKNWANAGLVAVTYEWLENSLLDAQAVVDYGVSEI